MRRLLLLSVLFSAACGAAVLAATDRSASDLSSPASQPTAKAVNRYCPVEPDGEVDTGGPTVTYKGKVIGFCCDHCVDTFNKNAEAYAANVR
jgi:hypothetical protein